jgi:hypothetical protein
MSGFEDLSSSYLGMGRRQISALPINSFIPQVKTLMSTQHSKISILREISHTPKVAVPRTPQIIDIAVAAPSREVSDKALRNEGEMKGQSAQIPVYQACAASRIHDTLRCGIRQARFL